MTLCLARVSARALMLLSALVLPAQLTGQGVGTVRGRVVDASNGRGLPDAQVTVAGTRLGTVANAAGEFTIANVPTGSRAERRCRRSG